MRTLRARLHRLLGLLRRREMESGMQAEMQAHIDGLTDRHIERGMTPEDARYAALREFGGVAQIAEHARDERRSLWLEQFGQDVRYAARSLLRSRTFTITAVLTLALGIGVNSALFSIFNMVALRPMPVRDPDGIVRIVGRTAGGEHQSRFSYDEFRTLTEGSRALEEIVAFDFGTVSLGAEPGVEPDANIDRVGNGTVAVELVSRNYFPVLAEGMHLGRSFLPEECRPSSPAPVIVLSHLFWQRHFQGDPNIVGKTLRLRRQTVTVIGVAPAQFSGENPVPPAGWLPLTLWSRAESLGPSGAPKAMLMGRLKPGVSEVQAKADLDAITSQRAQEFPGLHANVSVALHRGLHFINFPRFGEGLVAIGMLFFGFALVLMVACTNVANLLLARGVSRQQEIGVRLTLGAGRGRIVRQLLTENVLLCGIAAVVGLGLATWTLQMLLPVVVGRLPVDWALETRNLPFFDTTPDLRVLGFTAVLTVGATLIAGLLPAWHAVSSNLIAAMHNQGTAFGRGITPSRLRQTLVIGQVAISLMLLSSAGLLARNFLTLRKVDVGFDARAVFGVVVTPAAGIVDRVAANRQALETLRMLPGVAACAVASREPLTGAPSRRIRTVEGAGMTDDNVPTSKVSAGFFDTFGISLLSGRTFLELEQQSAARAVIVSESLARQLWPGQRAVGKVLAVSEDTWSPRDQSAPTEAFRECEVVGVARDVMLDVTRMRADHRRLLYVPFALEGLSSSLMYLRPQNDSGAALAGIVRAADAAGIGIDRPSRQSDFIDNFVMPFHALSILSGVLGVLALVMASIGLYGLMTFSVNQRVREIGIRMSLGANAAQVVGLFVQQGMRLVAVGLGLGLIGGGIFALLLAKLFFGLVNAFDPVAFGVATLQFAAIAWFACWLPARRATKVDPVVALRAE